MKFLGRFPKCMLLIMVNYQAHVFLFKNDFYGNQDQLKWPQERTHLQCPFLFQRQMSEVRVVSIFLCSTYNNQDPKEFAIFNLLNSSQVPMVSFGIGRWPYWFFYTALKILSNMIFF